MPRLSLSQVRLTPDVYETIAPAIVAAQRHADRLRRAVRVLAVRPTGLYVLSVLDDVPDGYIDFALVDPATGQDQE